MTGHSSKLLTLLSVVDDFSPFHAVAKLISIPRALFALRLFASVSLALFATYWLELQNSFWAATTAAIVCQPNLGASLQKGRYRIMGTVIGALVMVGLLALFAQQRNVLVLSLALWCGLCGCAAVILRNYASYAAALAGITAAIVFADSVADPNGAFLLAVIRVGEICIGIGSACIVMLILKSDTAADQLSKTLRQVTGQLWSGFMLSASSAAFDQGLSKRHELVRDFLPLRAQIDAVVGQSSYMRSRRGNLNSMVVQLAAALSSWRDLDHLPKAVSARSRAEVEAIMHALSTLEPAIMDTDITSYKRRCLEVAHQLRSNQPSDSAVCLMQSGALEMALCLEKIADCQQVLLGTGSSQRTSKVSAPIVVDPLPVLLAGTRVFCAVMIASIFWIQTAWSAGSFAIVFSAIATLVFAAMGDQALQRAREYSVGATAMMVVGGLLYFAVLPTLDSFYELLMVLAGLYGVVGYMQAGQSHPTVYLAMSVCSLPMLSLANPTVFDAGNFFNLASTIVIGSFAGTCFFVLIPAISSAQIELRLRQRSFHDLKRFLASGSAETARTVLAVISARLCALPATSADSTCSYLMSLSSSVASAAALLEHLSGKPGLALLKQAFDDFARDEAARGQLSLERVTRLIESEKYPATNSEKTRIRTNLDVFSEAMAQCLSGTATILNERPRQQGKPHV